MKNLTSENILTLLGYFLYDLHELGYLNEKGAAIINEHRSVPEEIVREFISSLKITLEE